ncbi:MAG: hypothetical protein IJ583_14965 [Firmicutes bacterium]|nr:hypothetical protein [Bacillota bacterium]
MIEKMNIRIAIFAAVIAGIYSLINFESLTRTALSMVITIIVAFILGSWGQNYLNKAIEKVEEEKKRLEEEQKEAENNGETPELQEELQG